MADAHRRWPVIGGYDDPAAWARRAVLNRSSSRLRRRGREHRAFQRVAGRADTSHPAQEPVFADEELWRAVRALSDRQRDVVLLLWFEELTTAEVATTLECGEETVRTHWRRARTHLADALGETLTDQTATDDTSTDERGATR